MHPTKRRRLSHSPKQTPTRASHVEQSTPVARHDEQEDQQGEWTPDGKLYNSDNNLSQLVLPHTLTKIYTCTR